MRGICTGSTRTSSGMYLSRKGIDTTAQHVRCPRIMSHFGFATSIHIISTHLPHSPRLFGCRCIQSVPSDTWRERLAREALARKVRGLHRGGASTWYRRGINTIVQHEDCTLMLSHFGFGKQRYRSAFRLCALNISLGATRSVDRLCD